MKILLLEPKGGDLQNDKNTLSVVNKSEPIGLCYVGAIAKNMGHDVRIIHQIYESNNDIVEKAKDISPDIIGFSSMTYNYDNALILAKKIKNKIQYKGNKPFIIFGGIHPTASIEIVKEKVIDFAVIGEGENTFSDLVDYIESGKTCYENLKGIAFFKKGEIIQTSPRPRLNREKLNSLPFPLRKGLPIREGVYRRFGLSYPAPSKQIRASISASRGCKFNCFFCTSPREWQQKWIHRNAENIVDEIEYLINEFGVNYIEIRDEDFTSEKSHVMSVCRKIKKRRIDISWYCQGRVSDVDEEMLREMKSAGCFEIEYGIESGDPDTLNKIKKGITISQIKRAVIMAHEQDLSVHGLLIIGFPWETKKSIKNTEDIIRKLPFDRIRLAFCTPFKGTQLEEEIKNYPELLISRNSEDYTTDIPVIRSRELTAEFLGQWRRYMYKSFYFSSKYIKSCMDRIKKEPKLSDSYTEWFKYLDTQV